MNEQVYLDYNATAPLAGEVRDAMAPWLAGVPANPSAVHQSGQRARAAVEQARDSIAGLCGGGDVLFTSGGTEADNLALTGLLGWPPAGHVVVSAIEHPAVLETGAMLQTAGVEVSTVEVDEEGLIDPAAVARALTDTTSLVSVMAANNETGTVQPIAAIAAAARSRGVPTHCDAVQAAAWLDLPQLLGSTELVSLAAHKIAGPPGIGALVLREPLEITPSLHGGGQQRGRRPGSEPTALIVGFGAACERVRRLRDEQAERVRALSERLFAELSASIPDLRVTVPRAPRLPNTVHFCVSGCPADVLVARLDLDGVAVSAGSACASGVAHGSYVLAAMGVPAEYRDGALRVSLGYDTTAAEVERAAAAIVAAVTGVQTALTNPAEVP